MKVSQSIKVQSQKFMASLGMSLSLICAVHCLATPFVLAFAPVFGSLISHESELYILVISLAFASYVLIKDFRFHLNRTPILIALIGAIFLVLGITVLHGQPVEPLVMSFGGFLMAGSYYVNWRAGRKTCLS